jgi:hypothetical protein
MVSPRMLLTATPNFSSSLVTEARCSWSGWIRFSTDYPFHRPGAAAAGQFFDAIPDPSDRSKIASGNAKTYSGWPDAPGR